MKPDRNNFAPRVGIVYKLDEKTVLRGGYGIFYNLFDRVGSEDQLALNLPGLVNNSLTADLGDRRRCSCCRTASPPNFLDPPNLDPAAGSCVGCASARSRATRPRPRSTRRASASSASSARDVRAHRSTASAPRARTWPPSSTSTSRCPTRPATTRSAPCPIPTSASSSGARRTASRSTRASTSASRSASRKGYGFGVVLHARRLAGQQRPSSSRPRARTPSRRTPATSRPGTGPATTTSATASPSTSWPSCPSARARSGRRSGAGAAILGDWTRLGHLRRALGRPFTVNQSSNNVGTEHDRAAQPGRATGDGRRRRVDAVVRPGRLPGRCPPAPSATTERNSLRGPDWQSLDLSLQRRIDLGSRVGAILRWDVFNVFNTDQLRPARTATSRTPPPWARSRRSPAIRGIMQLSAAGAVLTPWGVQRGSGYAMGGSGGDQPPVNPSRDPDPFRLAVLSFLAGSSLDWPGRG